MNIKEMTFEEFISRAEKEIGQKIDGKVKDLVEIVFYNLKNDAWSMNDLKDMIGAVKSARELKKRNIA